MLRIGFFVYLKNSTIISDFLVEGALGFFVCLAWTIVM